MTSADSSPAGVSVRGNLVIGVASIAVGAVVIPYGAGMPYIREGIPGPGLFPMMIGGLLIIFGVLIMVTSLLSVRRDRIHGEQMAAAEAQDASAVAEDGSAVARDDSGVTESPPAGAGAATAATTTSQTTEDVTGVPADADDVPEDQMATSAVMDTDIGSHGIRRWINGAILMGGILFFVLFAEILGFPLTMAILVTSIVWSLRAKWWVAVLTGVLTALGLWAMFEQGLLVQLPDGPFRGF